MSTFTRALLAGSVAALFFALKAVMIATGRDAYDDPLVNLFFYLGIAGLVVTFGLTGAALARRPGARGTGVAAAMGVGLGILAAALIAILFTALLPSDGSWVLAEVNLWVIAIMTLATILVLRFRTPGRV